VETAAAEWSRANHVAAAVAPDSLRRPDVVAKVASSWPAVAIGWSEECWCGSGQVGGDAAPDALDVLHLLTARGDIVRRAVGGVVVLRTGDDPRDEIVRGQAAACGGDVG
jgi:hypothetical protein